VPLPTTIIITTPWGGGSVIRPREAFIAPSDSHFPLPPGVTMQRWYLDDGVFMCPMVEFEKVLAALQQALLPPWAWSSICGGSQCGAQSLVPATSPLRAATRLHLEEGTEVLGVPSKHPRWGPTWTSLVQN